MQWIFYELLGKEGRKTNACATIADKMETNAVENGKADEKKEGRKTEKLDRLWKRSRKRMARRTGKMKATTDGQQKNVTEKTQTKITEFGKSSDSMEKKKRIIRNFQEEEVTSIGKEEGEEVEDRIQLR